MRKYDTKDFEKVVKGEATIEEMCEKYKVSHTLFVIRMNKTGYYIKKTRLKITSPHKNLVVNSYSECADELKVSEQTIRNYLKGKRVKIFEDLKIKVEVVK